MSTFASTFSENSVAVAGAGIIGLSVAWRLAQHGWSVHVFDSGPIGREASWAGAGMLSPGGEIEGPSSFATLALESRRIYGAYIRELERASGQPIDYQECGALDLAYSPEDLQSLEVRAEFQARVGITSQPLNGNQIRAQWPDVRLAGVAGARFYFEDAIVNPRDVLSALAIACAQVGVSIVPQCAVLSIEISANEVALRTAKGTEKHAAVVVAAGAWSGQITVPGVPPLPRSEPVKGHLIGYLQPPQTCPTIVRSAHTYLLQRANGLLIAGSSIEHVGFDREVDPEIVSRLAADAGSVFPHLLQTSPSYVWTGFRPASDALHIGPWNSPRLYLAYGHYRNGILLAPETARRLASEITANFGKR